MLFIFEMKRLMQVNNLVYLDFVKVCVYIMVLMKLRIVQKILKEDIIWILNVKILGSFEKKCYLLYYQGYFW